MGNTRKVTILILVIGLSVLLLTSCGEDKSAGPKCLNCDFWQKAFGRVGRFPAVSPVDPRLVAFTSPETDTSICEGSYHIWVAMLPEEEGDNSTFYQITCDAYDDFKPVWSPDGTRIAFERRSLDKSDIFVVDVTDLELPATARTLERLTDRASLPNSSWSPTWAVIGDTTWIAFSNSSVGGVNFDIFVKRYPQGDRLTRISREPADFAKDENGVLSAIFKDEQPAGNATSLIAFASPDRVKVGDIRVTARKVVGPPGQDSDTTDASAEIFLNAKDSGKTTPYTFRYRPAGVAKIEVRGVLPEYCTQPYDSIIPEPDVLNTIVLDFVQERGAVGLSSNPGVRLVYFDGRLQNVRTPDLPAEYILLKCVPPGIHTAFAANVSDGKRCSDTLDVTVRAGETTYVTLDCRCGLVGLSSNPGGKLVNLDGRWLDAPTPASSTDYIFTECQVPGMHFVFAANPDVNKTRCSDTAFVAVRPGETTYVTLDCTGAPARSRPEGPKHRSTLSARLAPSRSLTAGATNGIWLVDLGNEASVDGDKMYLVTTSSLPISEPALSPDGNYVAFIRGQDISREIVICDVSGVLAGTGEAQSIVIGLPGQAGDDVECWRIPERVGWFPGQPPKLVASISVCRGGAVPDDYEIWVADLSRFIK